MHDNPFSRAFITDFEFVARCRNGVAGSSVYLYDLDFTLIYEIFQDIGIHFLVGINNHLKGGDRRNGRIARIRFGDDDGRIRQRLADTVPIFICYLCIQHFAGGFQGKGKRTAFQGTLMLSSG